MQHGYVNDAITYFDNGLMNAQGFGATYLVRGDELAIVETGTSLCAPTILEGLAALGVAPRNVRHILVTHVHMDHAGGAGPLVEAMPEARVYLHSMSHEHLIDPERLLRSAERALGELFALHGTIVPVEPERLVAAEALDLDLGQGARLRAVPTPGHSPDHLAYYEPGTASLFTGDSVGIVLPRFHHLGPVTPPPTLDIEAQRTTFGKLLDLPIEHLLFSHAGPSALPAHETIRQLQASFEHFRELVETGLKQGHVDEAAIVRAMLPNEPIPEHGAWAIAGWVKMSINGMVRYYTKLWESDS